MSRISRKVLLAVLCIIISIQSICQKSSDYQIEGIRYNGMLDGYCAMTALQMNLDYYAFSTNQSLLLNLGWNYGFFYQKQQYFAFAYPCTDPVEEIVNTCNMLGFKAKVLTHSNINEAQESIIKFVSQDIPVIVQWIPHTILVYGYKDNGNTMIFHDPSEFHIETNSDSSKISFSGEGKSMNINEWDSWPYAWGMRGYQIVIVEPNEDNPSIEWANIWLRNSKKSLGTINSSYPGFYGIIGIEEAINDIKRVIEVDIIRAIDIIHNWELTFKIGVGLRRDASSFLSGQASISNNEILQKASIQFLLSAHHFQKGYSLVKWIKEEKDSINHKAVTSQFIYILESIVEHEKNAAEMLSNIAN